MTTEEVAKKVVELTRKQAGMKRSIFTMTTSSAWKHTAWAAARRKLAAKKACAAK